MNPNPTAQDVRRTGRLTVGLLSGVYIIDYIDRVMIAIALPVIAIEFGLTSTQLGFVLAAFGVTYMLGQLPGGLLADRFGARPLMLISLIAWSVFTAGTGFATGLVALLVLRALFGFAQAMFPPASFKALAERTTPDARTRSTGLMISSNFVGAGLGPLIVAPLVMLVGWRSTFFIVAVGGVVVGLTLWKLFPPPLPRRLTEPAAAPQAPATPLSHVLRNRLVRRCALMFACFNMLNFGMISWVPSYLVQAKGLSLVAAGLSSAIPMLVTAVGVVLGGWLMSRYFDAEPRRLLVPALVISASLLVPMLLTESTTTFTVLQTLAMFSSGIAMIGIIAMPLRALPRDLVGSAMGVVNTGGQLAGVLGPLVMGWLVGQSGFAAAFGFLAACTLAAAALALFTRPAAIPTTTSTTTGALAATAESTS